MNPKPAHKAGVWAVFSVYWKYVRLYPYSLATIIASTLVIQIGTLAAPLYLRQFFNLLASNTPTASITHALLVVLSFAAAMWLLEWAGRRVQERAVMYFETNIMQDILISTFSYLIEHSYNFFTSNFAGSLTHKVSKFSRSFERLADSIVLQFFPTFLFMLGAIAVLFVRNHLLGIALLVWTVIFLTFQIIVARLRQPVRVAAAEMDTRITATLADAISNQSNIALFSGERYEYSLFREVTEIWRKATEKLWVTDGWIWSGIGLFMTLIEVGLLAGAVMLWQQGLVTIGDFVLIQSYLLVTFDRLVGINRELRAFYAGLAEAGEMVAILQTPHEIQNAPGAQTLKVSSALIEFKNVNFSFHDDKEVLNDFNLTIRSNQKVALVGPSGAGKTTITKLLLRLFDVKGGSIDIDGQNIASVTQDSLRNDIAFVPQEPILFHRTLMENIRYGRRDATDAEVIEAAKKAHCHEFISQLPEQYETYVGERGIKLSGGERQRVAIARAILKNAPILVLDEATSSLDSESEALIQDALSVLMQNKTVIVIAHRLSTIMKMDRIVVLEGGAIVADGTHSELLEQGGLYQKLWSIQAGGFLVTDQETANISAGEEQSDDLSREDEDEERVGLAQPPPQK